MHILFTGASSFSGMWFVKELAAAGHTVTATFRSPLHAYQDLRRQRIEQILDCCIPIFDCLFGEERFLKTIEQQKHWDLFCHHAADVMNYKSSDFDVAAALTNNTKNIKNVLSQLKARHCDRIILTGSVFEQNEGAGSDHLKAVSPYGLSKGLTTETFSFYANLMGMRLGKFVIPNPFGPYEEARFTAYLIQSWILEKTAIINTPHYVRDNIHISLLAKSYAQFAASLSPTPGFEKINPSGYVESQGAFTQRFADEMRIRLSLPCSFELKPQSDFVEPRVRINTDNIPLHELEWNEIQAWDDLAAYYRRNYQQCLQK
jgi:UDP-glucose 4-epimerase